MASSPRTLLTTLGVLAALALVAVAARGSTSAGDARVRKPSELLLDILVSLYIVALGLGLVLLVVMLVLRRHARAVGLDPRRDALRSLGFMCLFIAGAFLLFRVLELREPQVTLPELQTQPTDTEQTPGAGGGGETYEAEFAWLPMLALGLLALLGGFAWWRAGKARGRARGARVSIRQ